jgi:hypothetical protein
MEQGQANTTGSSNPQRQQSNLDEQQLRLSVSRYNHCIDRQGWAGVLIRELAAGRHAACKHTLHGSQFGSGVGGGAGN